MAIHHLASPRCSRITVPCGCGLPLVPSLPCVAGARVNVKISDRPRSLRRLWPTRARRAPSVPKSTTEQHIPRGNGYVLAPFDHVGHSPRIDALADRGPPEQFAVAPPAERHVRGRDQDARIDEIGSIERNSSAPCLSGVCPSASCKSTYHPHVDSSAVRLATPCTANPLVLLIGQSFIMSAFTGYDLGRYHRRLVVSNAVVTSTFAGPFT